MNTLDLRETSFNSLYVKKRLDTYTTIEGRRNMIYISISNLQIEYTNIEDTFQTETECSSSIVINRTVNVANLLCNSLDSRLFVAS